jgi:guanidinopropionase
MRVVTIEEFFELGLARVIDEIRRVTGDGPTYVSIDVDALDAVYVPGTGAPEIGGFGPREAIAMIRGLAGLDLVGADVVEVSPPLDPGGGTARIAAVLMFELAEVMADSRLARRAPGR